MISLFLGWKEGREGGRKRVEGRSEEETDIGNTYSAQSKDLRTLALCWEPRNGVPEMIPKV